jgi:hypothetical protein
MQLLARKTHNANQEKPDTANRQDPSTKSASQKSETQHEISGQLV